MLASGRGVQLTTGMSVTRPFNPAELRRIDTSSLKFILRRTFEINVRGMNGHKIISLIYPSHEIAIAMVACPVCQWTGKRPTSVLGSTGFEDTAAK